MAVLEKATTKLEQEEDLLRRSKKAAEILCRAEKEAGLADREHKELCESLKTKLAEAVRRYEDGMRMG